MITSKESSIFNGFRILQSPKYIIPEGKEGKTPSAGTKGGSKTDYLDEQLGELKDKVSINKYESAESANDWWSSKGYDKPLYTPKTVVQDIKGLTPSQIQEKFALPATPKYIG